ncbi:MAG: class I SAM-dependent rRNA methyltransferase [Myxococcales bacterium]|nr:class I SAM-dependent rRNA methyltransferase [Myxococcales bacterium]
MSHTEASPTPSADPNGRVILRKGRARPLWFGHPWVYANAVEKVEGTPEPGDVVSLVDGDGRFIGQGLWNPRSQIPVRVLTRDDEALDAAFFVRRLQEAQSRRAAIGLPNEDTTVYRLVNSEGDQLPGLVVDVYGKAVAVQITTLGLWQRRELVFEALAQTLAPEAIYQVAAGSYAELEGFVSVAGVARGPSHTSVSCREDGIALEVEPLVGQKTGMFIDQRPARQRVGQWARGRRVLDCYAYAGGFALQAARGQAASVTAVDSSPRAVTRIEAHAAANQVAVTAVEADVFRFLQAATPGAYDLIIVDPPKFARARKDLEAARKGYERLNTLALRAAAPGALVVSCSCSQNVSGDDLERIVAAAGKAAGRRVTLLERLGPGADHPLPPAFPEGQYLKVLCAYVD